MKNKEYIIKAVISKLASKRFAKKWYGAPLNKEQLEHAKDWIKDCEWREEDEDFAEELTSHQIADGIETHYHGGVKQFLNDIDEE
jgi:hypothetical protein